MGHFSLLSAGGYTSTHTLIALFYPFLNLAMTVDTTDTSKDKNWDLLEFLNINSPEEIAPNGKDLIVLPECLELTNIESEKTLTENDNQRDQETPTESVKAEKEEEPKRKRRRTATDCRVEWRVSIANEKAEIIENVDKIKDEEMLLREKYGELKGVIRVGGIYQAYKNKETTIKDIFKKGKEELINAKREITEVIVKEKTQVAFKVRKCNNTKEDQVAFEIDRIQKQTLAEDIRVSVENSFCSRLYLTKLEAYRYSQVRYLTSLQTQISILTDGISRICENKEELDNIFRALGHVHGEINGINSGNNQINAITFSEANQKKVIILTCFLFIRGQFIQGSIATVGFCCRASGR